MTPKIDPNLIFNQALARTASPRKLNREKPEELRKACQEFEAIFIRSLLQNMRATVPASDLDERNIGREVYEEMMDAEVAKQIARKNELGIAELLFRQLSKPVTTDNTTGPLSLSSSRDK
jgi:flagellar protein FlgJ